MENIKFNKFLDNARILNKQFQIIPLLYGSVGLEVLTDSNLCSSDIDILIPSYYVNDEGWKDFKKYLEESGYVLVDEHEHTFLKDDIYYSYAKIEGLEDFANISLDDIDIYQQSDIQYKLLSLEQYLRIYESSLNDEYRMNVFKKGDKDKEKIIFIKSRLNVF